MELVPDIKKYNIWCAKLKGIEAPKENENYRQW